MFTSLCSPLEGTSMTLSNPMATPQTYELSMHHQRFTWIMYRVPIAKTPPHAPSAFNWVVPGILFTGWIFNKIFSVFKLQKEFSLYREIAKGKICPSTISGFLKISFSSLLLTNDKNFKFKFDVCCIQAIYEMGNTMKKLLDRVFGLKEMRVCCFLLSTKVLLTAWLLFCRLSC